VVNPATGESALIKLDPKCVDTTKGTVKVTLPFDGLFAFIQGDFEDNAGSNPGGGSNVVGSLQGGEGNENGDNSNDIIKKELTQPGEGQENPFSSNPNPLDGLLTEGQQDPGNDGDTEGGDGQAENKCVEHTADVMPVYCTETAVCKVCGENFHGLEHPKNQILFRNTGERWEDVSSGRWRYITKEYYCNVCDTVTKTEEDRFYYPDYVSKPAEPSKDLQNVEDLLKNLNGLTLTPFTGEGATAVERIQAALETGEDDSGFTVRPVQVAFETEGTGQDIVQSADNITVVNPDGISVTMGDENGQSVQLDPGQATVTTGDGDDFFLIEDIVKPSGGFDDDDQFVLDPDYSSGAEVSVDAGDGFDLLLLLGPAIKHQFEFSGGKFHMH